MPFNPLRTVWQLRPGVKPPFGGSDVEDQQPDPISSVSPAQVQAPSPEPQPAAPTAATAQEQGGVDHAELEQAAAKIVHNAKAAEQHRQEELVKAQKAAAAKAKAARRAQAAANQAQQAKQQRAAVPAQGTIATKPSCTLYISEGLGSLSYLDGLKAFMVKKGVRIAPLVKGQAVKQPALILLAPGDLPPAGAMCFVPDENKAALWAFLKMQLPELAS